MAQSSMPSSPPRLMTASWILYDLANTVYAATVTFLFVPLVGAAAVGITNSAAMILAGVSVPVLACLADRTGRAGRYCAMATLICIGAMSFWGVFCSMPVLLVAFFVATLGYQAALVFYDALLPSVAAPRHVGLVSGWGVGVGYIGTVFTLIIALPVQKVFGPRPAFFLTAAAFLLCALPCMLFVHDRRPIVREPFSRELLGRQWRELLDTLRCLPKQRALMWFLIGNFFAVDVLNTAILFFAKFIQVYFAPMILAGQLTLCGYTIQSIRDYIIIGGLAVNIPALGFGLALGYLADRLGARRVYVISLLCLLSGLVGAIVFGGWAPLLFLIALCCFGGLGLAGIWTAGRKLLIELVPPEHVARYFGLYGVTQKVSVLGSAICGVLMECCGPRVAIASQILALAAAFYCIYRMGTSGRNNAGC